MDLHQSKAHPRLPNTPQYKVLLHLPQFCPNSNGKFCPTTPNSTAYLVGYSGSMWSIQGVENGTNRNVDPTFLFNFNTTYTAILYRMATIYNAAER